MDLFVSKFFNKIDKKGRISLPSSFRNVLPKSNRNEIILYKSIKSPSIEGCGVGRLKEIAKRINHLDFFSAALSLSLHLPGVTWFFFQWSPDFPLNFSSDHRTIR